MRGSIQAGQEVVWDSWDPRATPVGLGPRGRSRVLWGRPPTGRSEHRPPAVWPAMAWWVCSPQAHGLLLLDCQGGAQKWRSSGSPRPPAFEDPWVVQDGGKQPHLGKPLARQKGPPAVGSLSWDLTLTHGTGICGYKTLRMSCCTGMCQGAQPGVLCPLPALRNQVTQRGSPAQWGQDTLAHHGGSAAGLAAPGTSCTQGHTVTCSLSSRHTWVQPEPSLPCPEGHTYQEAGPIFVRHR